MSLRKQNILWRVEQDFRIGSQMLNLVIEKIAYNLVLYNFSIYSSFSGKIIAIYL